MMKTIKEIIEAIKKMDSGDMNSYALKIRDARKETLDEASTCEGEGLMGVK